MLRRRGSLLAITALVALAVAVGTTPVVSAQTSGPSNSTGQVEFWPSIYFPGLEGIEGVQSVTNPTDGSVRYRVNVTPTTLGAYIVALYKFFTGATAIVAMFMITYGGLLWLLAGGNQGSISNAKEVITGAVAGMVIALLSYALLATISRGMVEFKSLDTRLEAQLGLTGSETSSESRPYHDPTSLPPRENFESTYGALFAEASADFGVNCTVLKAHALAESSGRPDARSGAGACGMLQVKPSTADEILERYPAEAPRSGPVRVSCDDLLQPRFGVRMGAAYIAMLRDGATYPSNYGYCSARGTTLKTQSSWGEQDKIAAYNGGPGANCLSRTCPNDTYWHCSQNAGYAETRGYVQAVQWYYNKLLEEGRACE